MAATLAAAATYPYVEICDEEPDGQRVRVRVEGDLGAYAYAEDANGANGSCVKGYFSPTPRVGERLFTTGWRQNGPSGTPNKFLQGGFTFTR